MAKYIKIAIKDEFEKSATKPCNDFVDRSTCTIQRKDVLLSIELLLKSIETIELYTFVIHSPIQADQVHSFYSSNVFQVRVSLLLFCLNKATLCPVFLFIAVEAQYKRPFKIGQCQPIGCPIQLVPFV